MHSFSTPPFSARCRGWLVGLLLFSLVSPSMVSADIFEWEWVDPADHSQGKQESSTVVPDGAGLVPAAGLNAGHRNLTKAYLRDTNLTYAFFNEATLTNADFTDAEIRGVNFWSTTDSGFTTTQLYSTASYQTGDLTDIGFRHNDLTGWNFAEKNLTNADFQSATLTSIDLSGANLTNADFSAPLGLGGSSGLTILLNANLSGANLTNARFGVYAFNGTTDLTNTNFTNAEIRGASFISTTDSGFTAAQLYSTASYQEGDLTGINLRGNDLTGWDFAGQNLTNVRFSDFFGSSSTLTNAVFTGAEVRGASFSRSTGAGFTASQLYSTASYQNGDLVGIRLNYNNLSGWDFAGKNLTDASFYGATLTNTNFTDAEVRGASFSRSTGSGITASQLYSTASYQNGDLVGIQLDENYLIGWDFAGKDLTNASFRSATLTNTNFTGAEVRGADFRSTREPGFTSSQLYSTASYQAGDLTGIGLRNNDLTGWDFAGKDLTNASFRSATLTNANFTGAVVRGANFYTTTGSGFTASQLYSTASYQTGDLTGINLGNNDLTGWNFAGKNLAGASFFAAALTNNNFTGADARAADDMNTSSAMTHNFIHPDGHVAGLGITANEVMRLWDLDPTRIVPFVNEPVGDIPIRVKNAMVIDSTGTLRAVFEDDDWGSTLTFDAGIGVSLDGTLELLVDSREGSNVSSMVGVTFDLFDWTGVTPSGTFAQITTDAGLVWDTSDLYSTGEVTLLSAPSILFADFDDNGVVDEADLDAWRAAFGSTTDLDADGNGDGVIDAADYTVWRDNYVAPPSGDYNGDGTVDDADLLVWRAAFGSTTDLAADGNGDGVIDAADYTVWRDHSVAASVAVPEPTGLLLTLLGLAGCGSYRR